MPLIMQLLFPNMIRVSVKQISKIYGMFSLSPQIKRKVKSEMKLEPSSDKKGKITTYSQFILTLKLKSSLQ